MPEITVIMRVHRGGSYLAEAADSVLQQTFRDWELLLVVTGSGAAAADAALACARDARIRKIVAAGGCGQALQAGTAAARGRFLAVLDEDDMALPRRLELQHAWLEMQPELGLLATATEVIDANGGSLGREPCIALHEDIRAMTAFVHVLRQSSVMFRRELLDRVAYRRSLDVGEDFDFFARAAEVTRVACLPAMLCRYRRHGENVTVQAARRNAAFGGLIRLLTRRRRTGRNEDYEKWHPRFVTIAGDARRSEGQAHLACAAIMRSEGYDDLAALHRWLASRADGGWRATGSYIGGVLAGILRKGGVRRDLAKAWLKEPAHQLLRSCGMPDRMQF